MSGDEKTIGLLEFLEMLTLTDEPGQPFRQVQPGDNHGEFWVDERGARAIIPDVAAMDALGLFGGERMALLEFARDCSLTWPVSLKEVLAWASVMGFEVAEPDGAASEEQKRRPGPRPNPNIAKAVDFAIQLVKDGKTREKAAFEAALEYGEIQGTVLRTMRRRLNTP